MTISIIWVLMIALSVLSAVSSGTVAETSAAVMEGAQKGVTLSLSLAGILCLWSGVCRVMEASGISERIARLLRPFLRRIFPSCREAAFEAISANVAANLLGLGNAATPLGMEAVRRLRDEPSAADELCRFVVINTASIQLLPTTIAAVRGAAGASSPLDILPAVWMTSVCALAVGLTASHLLERIWRRRGW